MAISNFLAKSYLKGAIFLAETASDMEELREKSKRLGETTQADCYSIYLWIIETSLRKAKTPQEFIGILQDIIDSDRP